MKRLAFLAIFTDLGCAKAVAARQHIDMKIVIVFFKADKFFSCKDRENLNFFVFLLIEFEIKLEKTNIYEKTFIVCMCLDDCFANDSLQQGREKSYR